MKVKELIEHLQQVKNQESEVYIKNTDPSDYTVMLKLRPKDIKENQKIQCDNFEDFVTLIIWLFLLNRYIQGVSFHN